MSTSDSQDLFPNLQLQRRNLFICWEHPNISLGQAQSGAESRLSLRDWFQVKGCALRPTTSREFLLTTNTRSGSFLTTEVTLHNPTARFINPWRHHCGGGVCDHDTVAIYGGKQYLSIFQPLFLKLYSWPLSSADLKYLLFSLWF